ncbi:MAG: hypothetical protein AAB555_00285, partial [Patescibacteria group bacterium]
MRRILIITAIVVVLAGAGVAGYFYFADSAGIEVAPSANNNANLPIVDENVQAPAEETAEAASVTTTVGSSADTPSPILPRLVQISAGTVVPGMVVVDKAAANASSSPETLVSYIERRSGNVYSYSVTTGTRTRTNNKTVPGIQSAVWLTDASVAFVRYLSGADFSTINTYALSASSSSGFFLSQNLSDVAVSPTNILTLSSGVNGSIASLSRIDGTRQSELFTTPLSSIRISFAGKNQYLAYTKPSAKLSGSAFLVDGSGRFSRVAGPLNGLVAKASPSGKWLIVSYASGSAMHMNLVNTTTGESLPLPVATVADKCVWTADDSAVYCGIPVSPPPNLNYPDDWYQGAVSFSDRIWKIDV